MSRSQPNIIVTGTPGAGKTTHCEVLAASTGLKHLSINEVVKERGCHEGFDDVLKSWIVDEDKVCLFKHRGMAWQKLIGVLQRGGLLELTEYSYSMQSKMR